MERNDGRTELLQRLADDLAMLAEMGATSDRSLVGQIAIQKANSDSSETESSAKSDSIKGLREQLSNPGTSFIGFLQEHAMNAGFYPLNKESGEYIAMKLGEYAHTTIDSFHDNILQSLEAFAYMSKWRSDLKNFQENGAQSQIRYMALSASAKYVRNELSAPINREIAIICAGWIASLYLPEVFNEAKRPPKPKHQTFEQEIFRKAVGVLLDAMQLAGRRNSKLFLDWSQDQLTEGPLSEFKCAEIIQHQDYRNGLSNIHLAGTAASILDFLAKEETTPEYLESQLMLLCQLYKLQDEESAQQQVPLVEETKWTILPPEDVQLISQGKSISASKEGSPSFVNLDRLVKLARLAMAWDAEKSRIAIADLESSGKYEYRVALLPQEIGGVTVVHAVAENASSGNAIYVFRGERGLDDDGKIWLTWQDVLSKDRRSARGLGARKILHTPNIDNNLLEYLTRSPNNLNKRGYSL